MKIIKRQNLKSQATILLALSKLKALSIEASDPINQGMKEAKEL